MMVSLYPEENCTELGRHEAENNYILLNFSGVLFSERRNLRTN
jgi:hypothetical protein